MTPNRRFSFRPLARSRGCRSWKVLLGITMAYVLLEGALRKWALPQYSAQLFVVKDVLLAAVYLMYFLGGREPHARGRAAHPLLFLMGALGTLAALQCFSPLVGDLRVALISARYYLICLPLVVVTARAFTSVDGLLRAGYWYSLTAIPLGLIGIIQTLSSPDSWINRYAWNTGMTTEGTGPATYGIATYGQMGLVRVTSTFSYISPYGTYLVFVAAVSLAVLVQARGRVRRGLLCGVLALSVINAVMTGSRGPLFDLAILLAVVLAGGVLQTTGVGRLGPTIVVVAALVSFVAMWVVPDVFEAFQQRVETAGDEEGRLMGVVLRPFSTLRDGPLIGAGTGSTFAAAGEAFENPDLRPWFPDWSEVHHDRVGWELGALGLLLELGIRGITILGLVRLIRTVRARAMRLTALVLLGYQATFLYSIPVYNSLAMLYFCFSCGVYLFLERAALSERVGTGRRTQQSGERARPAGSSVGQGVTTRWV